MLKRGKAIYKQLLAAACCCNCSLLLGQMHISRKAVGAKKEANNKVLNRIAKKHHHCILEGTLKSMLIASLERVYKLNVPGQCLADRCSDSQEEAVAFMTPSYLLVPLG